MKGANETTLPEKGRKRGYKGLCCITSELRFILELLQQRTGDEDVTARQRLQQFERAHGAAATVQHDEASGERQDSQGVRATHECVYSDAVVKQVELEPVSAFGSDARPHHCLTQPAHHIGRPTGHFSSVFSYKLGRSSATKLDFLLNRVAKLMIFASDLVIFAGCEVLQHGEDDDDDGHHNFAVNVVFASHMRGSPMCRVASGSGNGMK